MRIKLNIPLKISELQNYIRISEPNKENIITHITTNSKTILENDLFICLSDDKDKAKDYVNEAKEKGAITILTDDCFQADELLKIATLYKSKLKQLKHTIAITGSVGKTTTKELVNLFLSEKYITQSTYLNQNNKIGVSVTILNASSACEILILEMGMNHPGEISELSKATNPDIALITNVASAHIGNLGSVENIANAKLEICDGMQNHSITLVPFEEDLLAAAKNIRTVSLENPKANFFVFPLKMRISESYFDFYSETKVLCEKKINVGGKHVLYSCGFALALSSILKLSDAQIDSALSKTRNLILRQKEITIGKFSIYDDTYSSSPEAVQNALDFLSLNKKRKHSALLGDMLELGEYSKEAHYQIGKAFYRSGFVKLYTFGKEASLIAKGARDCGMNPTSIFENPDIDSPRVSAEQIAHSYDGETILFKASHSINASRIFEYLKVL